MTSLPVPVGDEIARRLEAARVAHQDAQEVAARCAREFRRLVLEAVDSGMSVKAVAAIAGVSHARVNQIVLAESGK